MGNVNTSACQTLLRFLGHDHDYRRCLVPLPDCIRIQTTTDLLEERRKETSIFGPVLLLGPFKTFWEALKPYGTLHDTFFGPLLLSGPFRTF